MLLEFIPSYGCFKLKGERVRGARSTLRARSGDGKIRNQKDLGRNPERVLWLSLPV